MLQLLAARENGSDHPNHLVRVESTRRSLSLELSKHFDMEKCHKAGVNNLDIDDIEGRYLLSSGADGMIAIHDLYNLSGEPKYSHPLVCKVDRTVRGSHKYSVETVQWYPLDTGMFMSSGRDKLLKVWDTNQLTVADEYEFSASLYSHDMSSIAASHNLIAVAGQSSNVRLIDIKSGAATHTLRGHKKAVLCVKWSTGQEFVLATGSEDNRVMAWDIRCAKGSLMVFDQHNGGRSAEPSSENTAHNGIVNGLCYTPNGQNLLSFGSDNRMRLWDTSTGKNTNVNFGKIANESRKCVHLAVSYNTTPTLVYVPNDSDIEICNVANGEKLDTLRGHYSQVTCCLNNASRQELYSGGIDRNILVWKPDLTTAEAFEDYLNEGKSLRPGASTSNFVRRIGAMADTWSSDED